MIVVLIRPTPQFNQSVLFKLRSAEAASLVRRSLKGSSHYDHLAEGSVTPAPEWRPGLRKRSDYWISQGWNVECRVQTDWYLCRVWDEERGTWSTQGPGRPVQATRTFTTTSSDIPTTLTSYDKETSTSPTSRSTAMPSGTSSSVRPTQTRDPGHDAIPGTFVGLWVSPLIGSSA